MNPMRILSLSPNISMILATLGLTDQVVGRTSYCVNAVKMAADRPEIKSFFDSKTLSGWNNIDIIGDWQTPDAVKISKHKPELVISSGTCTQYTHKTLGISQDQWLHFNVLTTNDLFDSIREIAHFTRTQDRAESLIQQLKQTASQTIARVRNKDFQKPKVIHERCICIKPQVYANPTETIMIGGHLAPEILEMAGGISGLSRPGEPCRWISSRRVVDYQPNIIIDNRCTTCPLRLTDRIEDRAGWEDIPAIKHKRVFRLDTNIANPNLCFITGLEELVSLVLTYEPA